MKYIFFKKYQNVGKWDLILKILSTTFIHNIATSGIQILSHNIAIYEFSSGLFDMRGLKCPLCMQINHGIQICMQACHKLNNKGITILLISI
jgi:hypothetical protein